MEADTEAAPVIALSQFFEAHPMATYAINHEHVITHWNKACQHLLSWSAAEMVGTRKHAMAFYSDARPMLSDLIVKGDQAALSKYTKSAEMPDAYEMEDFFPNLGESGHWLHFTAAPLRDAQGRIVGAVESMRDVTGRRVAEIALRRAHDNLEQQVQKRTAQLGELNEKLEQDNVELKELNEKLSHAQEQLMQSEKLASIGQLAAGVAHEINNPIGYIFSNFGTLQSYLDQLFAMLAVYEDAEKDAPAPVAAQLREMREKVDLAFLREDIPVLMSESKEGIVRVRHIVQDLKDFSRVDANQEWVWANLHTGIDSTLNIVSNEVKYKADVAREYGDIPDIECLPSQVNQIIMNLVVNASHAIGEERGLITIRTGATPASDKVWVEVADTGSGISKENMSRIFDPFFTTKPIGKGTGLGLSLAYGIVQKHHGQIEVDSELGKGTTFRITLPVRHVEGALP